MNNFAKQAAMIAVTIGGVVIGHMAVRSVLGGRNRKPDPQMNQNYNNNNFNQNSYNDTNNNQSDQSLNGLKNRKIFD